MGETSLVSGRLGGASVVREKTEAPLPNFTKKKVAIKKELISIKTEGAPPAALPQARPLKLGWSLPP